MLKELRTLYTTDSINHFPTTHASQLQTKTPPPFSKNLFFFKGSFQDLSLKSPWWPYWPRNWTGQTDWTLLISMALHRSTMSFTDKNFFPTTSTTTTTTTKKTLPSNMYIYYYKPLTAEHHFKWSQIHRQEMWLASAMSRSSSPSSR